MEVNSKYPLLEKCNPSTCISSMMMKCNRIVANIFRKHLKLFGITDSQLSMLFTITKAQDVNQKKLSDKLFMEKSTVNRNINRLMDHGYIEMSDSKLLKTTEKGRRLLEDVLPHWNKAMEETREVLNVEGINALAVVMNKLSG